MEEGSRGAQTPFKELLATELRLDPRQWEQAPTRWAEEKTRASSAAAATPSSEALLEVDCLVHREWVRGVSSGLLPPPYVPPLPAEEMHWLLQTSCDSPAPRHWQRVSVLCIRKTSESDTTRAAKRFLVSQNRGYSKESIHGLLTQVSQENLLQSLQEVLHSIHPTPSTEQGHPTSAYVREVVHQLYHTEVHYLQSGKAGGARKRTASRELHLGASGKPGKDKKKQVKVNSPVPASSLAKGEKEDVHSNLSPLLAALESRHSFYLVFPYLRFSLFDIAVHSRAMFNDSVSKPLFVFFQLLKALEHCHKLGITLGPLNLRSVFVDSRMWVQVRIPGAVLCLEHGTCSSKEGEGKQHKDGKGGQGRGGETVRGSGGSKRVKDRGKIWLQRERDTRSPTLQGSRSGSASTLAGSEGESDEEWTESAKDTSLESSPVKMLQEMSSDSDYCPPHSIPLPPVIPLSEAVKKWQHGELSNFDYLMLLNYHAGRRIGDPNNHPIFPWVSDFTHKNRSFRDLTKSKHRLNKGDHQLDFTYRSAQEEARRGVLDQDLPIPHHVGDISTDVTYYVYKARRTPREVLCSHVRPRWVPEEYPVSIEKMYMWTPDESIPEFFTDPLIFKSIHADLPDLVLPDWCPSPEAFIATHRRVLEGDYVSLHLHHWIDLTFGYKLSGEAAVRAKNVYVSLVDKHKNPKNYGIVQLFRTSHPKRVQCSSASVALLEWESYLGQSSVSSGTSFPINRREMVAPVVRVSEESESLPPGQKGEEGKSVRTLESIVEQQTQKHVGGERGDGSTCTDGITDRIETAQEDIDDSSFEQIAIPEESLGSTPSSYPNGTIGISYGESPLDFKLQSQTRTTTALKQKEGAVLNSQTPSAQQNRFRVVNIFRQRRPNQSDSGSDDYLWHNADISLPRDCHVLHRLAEQEERAHFVARSCKDFGNSLGESWEQKDIEEASYPPAPSLPLLEVLQRLHTDSHFSPSLNERVSIDVASAVATVVEMCCMKELRVATRANASLLERISVIRKLLCSGQLRLPSYLQNLAEFVLLPDVKKTDLKLPGLSASLLLQPFVPIVSFPPYFEAMYTFASALELLCREAGLRNYHESRHLAIQPLSPPSSLHGDFDPGSLDKIMALVSESLMPLLRVAQGEGFILLLLHLYPLFQYPETSFEVIQSHLDTLGQFMSHTQMDRLFTNVLLHFFDSPLEPHQQGYLLSRTVADILIRRFGLHAFLAKFLEFFLEAVLEPARLSTKGTGGVRKNIFRLKESESILTLMRSDFGQSSQFDDNKRQSHISDLTFSVDLTEMGGYNSDREYSSGDSDNDFPPEASLLARSGMVLGSLGGSMGDNTVDIGGGEETKDYDRDELFEGQFDTDKMMLLPQYATAESPESTLTEQTQLSHVDEIAPGKSSYLRGETEKDGREFDGILQSTLRIDTTSTEFRTSLNSPSSAVTPSHNFPSMEDSFQSCTSNVESGPFSKETSYSSLRGGPEGKDVSPLSREGFPSSEVEEKGEGERKDEGAGEEEEMEDKMAEVSSDPQVMAINQRIAEVAGDCLCWLQRRLGPLLATQHIVKPLLNGMHRCFMGVLEQRGREVVVLKCLLSMAELYGESVLLKMYLPHAEGWVTSATNRMTMKSESNLAASLALVKLITQKVSLSQLEEVTMMLCDRFFIPLIQLLSSQTIFPSGGSARATICHSLVLILLKIGERLGREKSSVLLLETLRLFFTCFDAVYMQCSPGISESLASSGSSRGRSETASGSSQSSGFTSQASAPGKLQNGRERGRSNTASPVASGSRWGNPNRPKKAVSLDKDGHGTTVVLATQVTSHPLSSGSDKTPANPNQNKMMDPSEALEQLHDTFSPAMAHAMYIPFCKLLGQIKLNTELRNTELIEQLAYRYDEDVQQQTRLPSVFLASDNEQSSSSNSESEDSGEEREEDELVRDVTIKLGPVVALQKKRGLDQDAVNFGRPSWFINLQDEGGETGVSLPTGSGGGGGGGGVGGGMEKTGEGLVGTGLHMSTVVASGVGVGGSMESGGRGAGGEEGGGKGWIEGVRGSAMATASGILQLIQSRNVSESQQQLGGGVSSGGGGGGAGGRVDSLTRHSVNFDMKFQSAPTQQAGGHGYFDGKPAQLSTSPEEIDGHLSGHLSGHWSDLWETQLRHPPHSQEPYCQFQGKKLQTYAGHKGSVRCLAVSDSEHFFISSSKDKTVKLWSLKNQGDGSAHISPYLTYSRHQKSVSHVELVTATGNAISCDGTVHLWDPESGYSIHQFSSPRSREFLAMKLLLPPQPVAVVATNDLTLRFIDFRAKALQHAWKVQFPTGGFLRCLTCGDNWVAVGNNTGTINTLDLRMGELLNQWKPSDFSLILNTTWNENLFQLWATRRGNLVSSVGPGTLHLWRPSSGKLLAHIRGQSSTTHCLDTVGEQLVSASSNGQVVIHNCFERTRDPSSTLHWVTKVRTRELKGGVSSMATLQENRLLLLGSDNGQVVLVS